MRILDRPPLKLDDEPSANLVLEQQIHSSAVNGDLSTKQAQVLLNQLGVLCKHGLEIFFRWHDRHYMSSLETSKQPDAEEGGGKNLHSSAMRPDRPIET
jgi:hypothetical protein